MPGPGGKPPGGIPKTPAPPAPSIPDSFQAWQKGQPGKPPGVPAGAPPNSGAPPSWGKAPSPSAPPGPVKPPPIPGGPAPGGPRPGKPPSPGIPGGGRPLPGWTPPSPGGGKPGGVPGGGSPGGGSPGGGKGGGLPSSVQPGDIVELYQYFPPAPKPVPPPKPGLPIPFPPFFPFFPSEPPPTPDPPPGNPWDNPGFDPPSLKPGQYQVYMNTRTIAINYNGIVSNYLSYSGNFPGQSGYMGIYTAPFTVEKLHTSSSAAELTYFQLRDALGKVLVIGENFTQFLSANTPAERARTRKRYSFNETLRFEPVVIVAPPPTPVTIPDYIPLHLPKGVPDPIPDNPRVPDRIPQKLPGGVPDPIYPGQDPEPGEPEKPPEEDPEKPPEKAPGSPGRDPEPDDPPNEPEKPPPEPDPDVDPPPDPQVPPPDPGRDPGSDPDDPNREPIKIPGFDPNPYDPIGDPGTDPGEPTPDLDPNPGQDPIQDPTSDPNRDPLRIPGWDPTGDPFQDPFRDPRRDPFRDPIRDPTRDPGRDPIDDPGRDPRLDPWRDPGYNPGEDPGDYPRTDPGDDPARDPGEDPREDDFPWTDPRLDPIDDPARDPGDDPQRDPQDDPVRDPGNDPWRDPGNNDNNDGGDDMDSVDPGHPGQDDCTCSPIIQIRTVTVERVVIQWRDMPCNYRPPEYVALPVKVLKAVIPVPNTNLKIAVPGSQNITVLKGTEGFARTLHDRVYEIEAWVKTRPDVDPKKAGEMVELEIEVPGNFDPVEGILQRRKVKLSVPAGYENLYSEHFRQMMDHYQMLCETFLPSQRAYQILGGNSWFPKINGATVGPMKKELIDAPIKSVAEGYALELRDPNNKEEPKLANNFMEWLTWHMGVESYRAGNYMFPAYVQQSLLTYTDDQEELKIDSFAQYFNWFIKQFDILMGEFPIKIKIADSDPLTEGNQEQYVEFPNISESLAEMYALALSGSTNADLSINFLMRLASEVIAAKNAAIIGGEYARGNAAFLGYQGKQVVREVGYAFNPKELDDLAKFLKESKAQITGWEETDPESVVGFLQKIVFAAGIIKAAFFRNKHQMDLFEKEVKAMLSTEDDDKAWKAFLDVMNTQDSEFNRTSGAEFPKSEVDNKPVTDPDEKPAQ